MSTRRRRPHIHRSVPLRQSMGRLPFPGTGCWGGLGDDSHCVRERLGCDGSCTYSGTGRDCEWRERD